MAFVVLTIWCAPYYRIIQRRMEQGAIADCSQRNKRAMAKQPVASLFWLALASWDQTASGRKERSTFAITATTTARAEIFHGQMAPASVPAAAAGALQPPERQGQSERATLHYSASAWLNHGLDVFSFHPKADVSIWESTSTCVSVCEGVLLFV